MKKNAGRIFTLACLAIFAAGVFWLLPEFKTVHAQKMYGEQECLRAIKLIKLVAGLVLFAPCWVVPEIRTTLARWMEG
jgi:hypothetical protein